LSLPQLAYTVHPGKGPYLGLVHGFLSSSSQWMHNLGALARVCRPVTIDLLGHGKSPAPDNSEMYHPDAYIHALSQIHSELGGNPWFVCGYSIGAGLTIRYTHRCQSAVLGHIFTNSSSGFADTDQAAIWRTEGPLTAQKIADKGLRAIERIAVHPKFAKRLPNDIYNALVMDAHGLSPAGVANTLRITTPNVSIRDIACANNRPALLCHGTFEARFEQAKLWAVANMPMLEVVDLAAGHGVNMEDSKGFNRAVCAFIERHTP